MGRMMITWRVDDCNGGDMGDDGFGFGIVLLGVVNRGMVSSSSRPILEFTLVM